MQLQSPGALKEAGRNYPMQFFAFQCQEEAYNSFSLQKKKIRKLWMIIMPVNAGFQKHLCGRREEETSNVSHTAEELMEQSKN